MNQSDFSYFRSMRYHDTPESISFRSICLLFKEKKIEIDFQDGSHLRFPIGSILAIFFYLEVIPTMFGVSWLFRSEKN